MSKTERPYTQTHSIWLHKKTMDSKHTSVNTQHTPHLFKTQQTTQAKSLNHSNSIILSIFFFIANSVTNNTLKVPLFSFIFLRFIPSIKIIY
jgi:hypothetical protein